MQQELYAMQLGAVLVGHHGLLAAAMPSVQKALHRRSEMPVGRVKLHVELREHELIIADEAARRQQGVAQGRAMALAMNLGMLGQQLAQQRGARARQAGNANKT